VHDTRDIVSRHEGDTEPSLERPDPPLRIMYARNGHLGPVPRVA